MQREDRYDSLFKYYGDLYGVDWTLLKAQVKVESNFNPRAVSKVGAKGLAQFMKATWYEWAGDGEDDVFNPEHSIKAQARYMAWLIKKMAKISEKNKIRLALACYNYGIGRIRRLWKIYGKSWGALYRELPLETQKYVFRVYRYWALFKRRYIEFLKKEGVRYGITGMEGIQRANTDTVGEE